MSEGRYSMDWLESKLDLFDSEKSGLSVDLHNRRHQTGLLSYILGGCAVLALIITAVIAIAPNAITGGLYRAGLNVDAFFIVFGIIAVACCAAAILFSKGTLRLGAIGVAGLTGILAVVAILTMQGRLRPIELNDADGLESVNRFKFGSYTLTQDIELGSDGVEIGSFAGRLNGAGHAIVGGRCLHIKNNHGSVEDIAISGASVSGGTAAILCDNNYGSITGVAVADTSVDCESGALILNNSGRVNACSVAADYKCGKSCGGIALNNIGSIDSCEFVGSFDCAGEVGGIAHTVKKGEISNCIVGGSVLNAGSGSCGVAFRQPGGSISRCFADIDFADGISGFYPICSSVLQDGKGSVTRCYAIEDPAYVVCGDCSLLSRKELNEARLLGFDFERVWYFDEQGELHLVGLAEGPLPERTEEVQPTATPTPTPAPTATPTPVPVTPEPTLSPQEMFGELDRYPTEDELFEEPLTGSVKQGHNANVRPGPGGEFRSFMRLGGGEQVKIYAKSGEWYLIGYNEVFGWVHEDMIRLDQN